MLLLLILPLLLCNIKSRRKTGQNWDTFLFFFPLLCYPQHLVFCTEVHISVCELQVQALDIIKEKREEMAHYQSFASAILFCSITVEYAHLYFYWRERNQTLVCTATVAETDDGEIGFNMLFGSTILQCPLLSQMCFLTYPNHLLDLQLHTHTRSQSYISCYLDIVIWLSLKCSDPYRNCLLSIPNIISCVTFLSGWHCHP